MAKPEQENPEADFLASLGLPPGLAESFTRREDQEIFVSGANVYEDYLQMLTVVEARNSGKKHILLKHGHATPDFIHPDEIYHPIGKDTYAQDDRYAIVAVEDLLARVRGNYVLQRELVDWTIQELRQIQVIAESQKFQRQETRLLTSQPEDIPKLHEQSQAMGTTLGELVRRQTDAASILLNHGQNPQFHGFNDQALRGHIEATRNLMPRYFPKRN